MKDAFFGRRERSLKHKSFGRKAQQSFLLVINTPRGAAVIAKLGIPITTEIRLGKARIYQAAMVSRRHATLVCQKCLAELCSCRSKHDAPVIFCKPVVRRGRAVPLSRKDLPVQIRKAA